MSEENWTVQEQIDYLSGVVAAHRSLSIAYMGAFMAIQGISGDDIQGILSDLIGTSAYDPQHPQYSVGHRETLETIQDAIARIISLRGF